MASTAVLHLNGSSRGSLTKKLLLWLLLVVQLCFIFCFWIIQSGLQDRVTGEATYGKGMNGNKPRLNVHQFKGVPPSLVVNRVNFVTKAKNNNEKTKANISASYDKDDAFENKNQFKRDYCEFNTNRLMNITGIEAEMPELGLVNSVWCFREGTLNESAESMLYWNIDAQRAQCKCRQYWHGKDCAQPEVIWRTLMLPGKQFKLRELSADMSPHRLVYLLEGYFHSLDLLELQIKAVDSVVDYFLIYYASMHVDVNTFKALRRRLNELLSPQRYILYHCSKRSYMPVHSIAVGCDTTEAFKYFKRKLAVKLQGQLSETDLLLYSNENIIYSKEPLSFLKYYATSEMPLWRFRLKYNVYGFYWQHPARTHLSGFICSFSYVENSSKLQSLLTTDHSANIGNTNIIGDLNHYGGWFCQYCQHPDEIMKELLELPIDSSSYRQFQLPNGTRNRYIDAKYLENLIAQGIHIDGKTRLEKIRQYNDKHFAPSYAEKCKWKFGNILTNLFEAMESDYIIEEAEGGAGF